MKKVIILIMVVLLSAFLVLPCFGASDVQSASALSYFSNGSYSWTFSDQTPETQSFPCTVEIWTAVRDWSIPFSENTMVQSGYFTSDHNLGVRFVGSSSASMSGVYYYNTQCNIRFNKPMTFVGGVTYQFCIRLSDFYIRYNGDPSYFEASLSSASFALSSAPATRYSMTVTRSDVVNYSGDYLLTFTPASDLSVNVMNLLFTSDNTGNLATYNSCGGSLIFSNIISYSGSGDYVSTNPQLDNIQGQLNDINDALNNNPYSDEMTVPEAVNPGELVGESEAIGQLEDMADEVDGFLSSLDPTNSLFWRTVIDTLFNTAIFTPFIIMAVLFLCVRAVLGR